MPILLSYFVIQFENRFKHTHNLFQKMLNTLNTFLLQFKSAK
jgi:hypothetical protein